MVEELKPAGCPFCGAVLEHCDDKDGEFWMHPGFVTDGECFMSGQGVFPRNIAAWNKRTPTPDGTGSGEGWTCAARKQGTAGGNDPADCDWPFCGCDPYADKVLAATEESGRLSTPKRDEEQAGEECEFCQGNWCARGLCPACGSPEIVAARAAVKQGQSQAFAREERYIVIKRKHLTPVKEDAIRSQLAALEVPTVECVVVEGDWPEYEAVWKMIEARALAAAHKDRGA